MANTSEVELATSPRESTHLNKLDEKRHNGHRQYPAPLPTAFMNEEANKEDTVSLERPSPSPPMSRRNLSMMSTMSDDSGFDSDGGSMRRRRPRLERRMSTIDVLYQMQNLQLDEDVEERESICSKKPIHPHSSIRTRWDLVISIMLAYNAFTIPYRVCFNDVLDTTNGLWYVDRLVDVCFLLDVCANFHTGFVRSSDGQVELEPGLVRNHYLKSWFFVDFVSSIPYEVIIMLAVDSDLQGQQYSDSPQLLRTTKALKVGRYIRFLKVVKVLRLVRAVHIFKRFEKALFMRHSASSIAKFLGFIIYLNHILACIFYLIGDLERSEGRVSWLSHPDLESQGDNMSLAYLYAFYYSLMTTTTIGYGDVHPISPPGRLYALIAMAIGACVFSYGVTHVITLMSALNQQNREFREKMDRIATYMSFRNLPHALRSDIREFFHYTHSTKTEKRMLEVEKEILSEMSPSLSHEVVLFVNRQIVDKVAFLREVDHRFFQRIVRNLESATFAPNELVINEGEKGDKLYIISKGVVELMKTDKMVRVGTRADGGHFGMISLVENGPTKGRHICSVRTMTYCDFRTLSRRAFMKGLRRYPGAKDDFKRIVAKEFKEFSDKYDALDKYGMVTQKIAETMLTGGGVFELSGSSKTPSNNSDIGIQKNIPPDQDTTEGRVSSKRISSNFMRKPSMRRHSDLRLRRNSDLGEKDKDDEEDGHDEYGSDDEKLDRLQSRNLATPDDIARLRGLMDRLERFLDSASSGGLSNENDLAVGGDGGELEKDAPVQEKGGADTVVTNK